MGQNLSDPVKQKDISFAENETFSVASCKMQGWRPTMEDYHTQILGLPDDPRGGFFGVFDGHGGAMVSQFLSTHLHRWMFNNQFFRANNVPQGLTCGCLEFDDYMRDDAGINSESSGSTANVVVIKNDTVYCANVGDSRAIMSLHGRAVPLSIDHKPFHHKESKRISRAGGSVINDRVNGSLALSRAFGDYSLKTRENLYPHEQCVTAMPDVTVCPLTKDIDFIFIACDGVWDVMSDQEVVDFVTPRISAGCTCEEVLMEMLECCISPDTEQHLGCDNMTAILILCLLGDKMPEYKTRLNDTTFQSAVANLSPDDLLIRYVQRGFHSTKGLKHESDSDYDEDDDQDIPSLFENVSSDERDSSAQNPPPKYADSSADGVKKNRLMPWMSPASRSPHKEPLQHSGLPVHDSGAHPSDHNQDVPFRTPPEQRKTPVPHLSEIAGLSKTDSDLQYCTPPEHRKAHDHDAQINLKDTKDLVAEELVVLVEQNVERTDGVQIESSLTDVQSVLIHSGGGSPTIQRRVSFKLSTENVERDSEVEFDNYFGVPSETNTGEGADETSTEVQSTEDGDKIISNEGDIGDSATDTGKKDISSNNN